MSSYAISTVNQQVLLDLAKESIAYHLQHELQHNRAFEIDPEGYPSELREDLSSFVTLHLRQKLRGCIGGLEATQPLVVDVVKHAYAAAFRDPRFPPLSAEEFSTISIDISILTPQRPIDFANEDELLSTLRPGVDGLILKDGHHHSTFLPSVWEQIPDRGKFLQQLKLKAGLPSDYWSSSLKAYRYTTFSFSD